MQNDFEADISYKHVLPKRYAGMLNSELQKTYKVVTSCKSIFNQKLNSQNNANFSSSYVISPSIDQAISDFMVEEVSYTISVTFTNTGAAAIPPFGNGTIAINPYANLATTGSLTTVIGNSTSTISPCKLLPLLQFNNDEAGFGTDFPSASNTCMFTDLNGTVFTTEALKSVFLNYSSSTYGQENNFACVEWNALGANLGYDNNAIPAQAGNIPGTGTRQISFTVRSPIWNGINSIRNRDASVYTGITNFQLNKIAVSNLVQRVLLIKCPAGLTITAMTVMPFATPCLYYNIYNFAESIPRPSKSYLLAHDYSNLQQQIQSPGVAGVPAYQSTTLTLNSFNLNSIPTCIYLFVSDDKDLYTLPAAGIAAGQYLENSDSPGFQITSANIQFAGQNVIQNLENAWQVYNELSASEGFQRSYTETGFTIDNLAVGAQPLVAGAGKVGLYGSVLRIDVSKLNLDWATVTNGVNKTLPFSATLKVTNLSSRDRIPVIFCQPVYDRMYVIDKGAVVSTYSIVTPEVLNKLKNAQLSLDSGNDVIGGRMLAGAWYNDLWDGVKDAGKWVWDNKSGIADAAKLLGLGKKKGQHKGKGIDDLDEDSIEYNGGKLISKKDLHNKLKFL